MKNKLCLKIVLGILIVFILMIPIFIFVNNDNKNKEYDSLLEKIKSATSVYLKDYNLENSSSRIKLGKLKEYSLIDDALVNPKTNRPLSNESYIINNNGTYEIKLYDIPKEIDTKGLIITFNGDQNMQNNLSVRYSELGINVYDGGNQLDYSTQYFVKNKEVQSIETSKPRNYEVVYTVINSKGELAKVVRTVIVQ